MSYSVEWTAEAEITYNNILQYLAGKWTDREVRNFIYRTEEVLRFIRNNPFIYPRSDQQEIHWAVVTKQTSLYYEIYLEKIVLLSFSDNRKDSKTQED